MLQAFRYFIRLLPLAVFSAFCFSGFWEWVEHGDSIERIKARAAWQPGDEEVGSYSILVFGWLLCGALAWHYFFKMFKSLFEKKLGPR